MHAIVRFVAAAIVAVGLTSPASAQGHSGSHVAKHGFMLFGTSDVYAAHIIAQPPHNYQVLLQLDLEDPTLSAYFAARAADPGAFFRLVLDPLDLSRLASVDGVTGTIYSEHEGRDDITVATFALPRVNYTILYFNELPSTQVHQAASWRDSRASTSCSRNADCASGSMCVSTGSCGERICRVIF
jgi:hypothetical protein